LLPFDQTTHSHLTPSQTPENLRECPRWGRRPMKMNGDLEVKGFGKESPAAAKCLSSYGI